MNKLLSLTLGLAVSFAGTALAQEVTIGVTLGATGPGASLGVHYKNAFQLMPKTVGGLPVKFIILEDNSDPTVAAKNARRLIAEDKVDAIMGTVSVPSTTQVALIGNETKTPVIALSPVALPPNNREWIFTVPQPIPLMMKPIVDDMVNKGVKKIGYIGFSDSVGRYCTFVDLEVYRTGGYSDYHR